MAPPPNGPTGDLALDLLKLLDQSGSFVSSEAFPHIPTDEFKSALDRLKSRSMVTYDTLETIEAVLEPEGEQITANGSHEARVFEALRQAVDGLTVADLEKTIGDKSVTRVGQSKAFQQKWISKTGDGKLRATVDSIEDVTKQQLALIQKTRTHPDSKVLADLRKRKLIRPQKVLAYRLHKGPSFALEIAKEETELTFDMLASGSWKSANFKAYNFQALGADQHAGALHPLSKVREEFRKVNQHQFWNPGTEVGPNESDRSSSRWDSKRWRRTSLSSRVSGISTLSSSHSNILLATCKTPSSFRTLNTRQNLARKTPTTKGITSNTGRMSRKSIRPASSARSATGTLGQKTNPSSLWYVPRAALPCAGREAPGKPQP